MSESLNICLVSRRFPLLSSNNEIGFLWPIARGLVKLGHTVSVITWRNRERVDYLEREGVKAYFLGESPGAVMANFPDLVLRKFRTLHRDRPFHLVHSLDNSGVQVGLSRRELGVALA